VSCAGLDFDRFLSRMTGRGDKYRRITGLTCGGCDFILFAFITGNSSLESLPKDVLDQIHMNLSSRCLAGVIFLHVVNCYFLACRDQTN